MNAVFSAKRAFKHTGTKYKITVNLRIRRKNLLNEARLKFGNHNVWLLTGETYEDKNGKKFHIQSRSDIEQIF